MKFYKDSSNKVHALEDSKFENLLPPGCSPITSEEAAILIYQDKTKEQIKQLFLAGVQNLIDVTAQSRGYDSGVSLASYATDTHPPFAAEAAAFIPWRSSIWLQCYTDWAEFEAGTMPMPESVESYISTLPGIVWPA